MNSKKMITLAAGMESDGSDSELEIVFASDKPIDSKEERTFEKKENTLCEQRQQKPEINTFRNKLSTMHTNHKKFNRNYGRQCLNFKSSELYDDLRYAIMKGNLEDTKSKLSKDIFVDVILKDGWTGLMHACSAAHPEIVSFLLEKKADPNYHKDMFTPLMAVCSSKKNEDDLLKCCSLLLQYGANVNARERHYTTPLMFAAREGHKQIITELIDQGAELNMQDNKGNTALALAASRGYGPIVRKLIEKGADVKLINNMGQTAVDLAYDYGHNEILSLFEAGRVIKNSIVEKTLEKSGEIHHSFKNSSGDTPLNSVRPFSNSKKFEKHGELELFLNGVDCQDLIDIFKQQQLNFHDLLIMNDEELEKIGVNQMGARKKILEACKSVHKKEWQNSSLPNLKQNSYISCPDAVAMMANIAKHLKYISTSVIYIRQQIQSKPRILELAQETASVHDLVDEIEDSLKNMRNLNEELRFLKLHLDKVQDNINYIPADFIVETVPDVSRKRLYAVVGIVTTSALVIGLLWKQPINLSSIQFPSLQIKIPFLT